MRRAKLYYLRGRVGKRARVAERRWGIEDELVVSEEEAEAVDSEGLAASTRRRPRARGGEGEEVEDADGEGAEEAEAGPAGQTRSNRTRERARQVTSQVRPSERERRIRPELFSGRGLIPKPKTGVGALVELVVIVAGGRPGAADPGVRDQAVPDPLAVDGAHTRRQRARAGEPLSTTSRIPRSATSSSSILRWGLSRAASAAWRASRVRPVPSQPRRSPTPTSSSGSSPVPGTRLDRERASCGQR